MSAKALIQPLQLGAISLRNRVLMSALTRDRSVPTNVPNSVNVEHYEQRAAGGAGLIVTEGTLISQQGTEWRHAPGIWSKPQVDGWKKVTDAVHAKGGAIYCQLWHVGRLSHPDAPEHKASGRPVYGPSAIAARGGKFRFLPHSPGYVTPTAIDDPRVLVQEFKQAGINAKEAGFDGVEVHGANGYVVNQFLDSTSNQRTDKWGGSIENRARFGLEVVKELIEVWGADRVAIKLSPAGGYNDVGMPLEDNIATYSYFITEVDKLKVAYIALVRYTDMFDPVFDGKKRGTQHDIIDTYGPLIKNAKKVVNAKFTPEEGAEFVASGKADAVAFGMLWITHPDVAERIRLGKPLDNTLDYAHLHGTDGAPVEEQRIGYTNYPALEVLN